MSMTKSIKAAAACLLAAASAVANDGDKVADGSAAVVDRAFITVGDVMRALTPLERELRRRHGDDQARLGKELRESYDAVLDKLVEQRLILNEFEKRGGALPEKAVSQQIDETLRKRFKNDRSLLLAALAEDGLSLEQWQDDMRDQLIVSLMMREQVGDKVWVSPRQIREAYEARRAEFAEPTEAELAVIVLNRGATTEEQAAQKARLERVREELVSGARDFAAAAKELSEGPHAADGGAWGWMDPRKLRPALTAAVAALEPGGISPVIETGDDLCIVKLAGRRAGQAVPEERAMALVEKQLREKESERLYDRWMAMLKRKHYVNVF